MDDIKRNCILMECMLEGFSSVVPRDYFTQPFNLHHDMVKLQINQYLKSSVFNNLLLNQNPRPKNNDIDQLIEKIFSISVKNNHVIFYTLCDLALHHLIRHPIIKENQEFNDYCLSRVIGKALQHQEPYYLRLLLRAGVVLTFSQLEDDFTVNEILIKHISSPDVKCLAWLTRAVSEVQKFSPNDLIIRQCLQNAALEKSFEREMYSFVYGNSMQINVHTLRHLARHLDDQEEFSNIKQLISERIEFLLESDFHSIDQFNLTLCNKTSPNLSPIAIENLDDKLPLILQ